MVRSQVAEQVRHIDNLIISRELNGLAAVVLGIVTAAMATQYVVQATNVMSYYNKPGISDLFRVLMGSGSTLYFIAETALKHIGVKENQASLEQLMKEEKPIENTQYFSH